MPFFSFCLALLAAAVNRTWSTRPHCRSLRKGTPEFAWWLLFSWVVCIALARNSVQGTRMNLSPPRTRRESNVVHSGGCQLSLTRMVLVFARKLTEEGRFCDAIAR